MTGVLVQKPSVALESQSLPITALWALQNVMNAAYPPLHLTEYHLLTDSDQSLFLKVLVYVYGVLS